MKKLIKILSTVMAIGILFSGCGSSSSDVYNDIDSTENSTFDEKVTSNETTNDSEIIVPNEDGIIELSGYSYSVGYLSSEVSEDNVNESVFLIWKDIDVPIKKIKQSDTVGIYDTFETLTFLKIDTASRYIVPLNFAGITEETPTGFPETFSHGNYKKDFGNLTNPGNPIIECNNTPLDEFINANSCSFHEPIGFFSSGARYWFIEGEKYEEFELGGYVGTDWKSVTVKADTEIYTPKIENKLIIPVEKTKKGFFKVDISSLDKAIYFIKEYNLIVEII